MLKKTLYKFPLPFMLFLSITAFSQDFEVSPVLIEFGSTSADTIYKEINVYNHSTTPRLFTIKQYDYDLDSNGHRVSKEFGTSLRSMKNISKITPSTLLLQPNESGKVSLKIAPRDYSIMRFMKINVVAQNESNLMEEVASLGTGIKIKGSIAVIVIQNSDKSALFDLQMTDIKKSTDNNDEYYVTVNNKGESRAKGKLMIMQSDITSGSEKELETRRIDIMPGVSKKISFKVPGDLSPNTMISVLIDPGAKHDLIGSQLIIE